MPIGGELELGTVLAVTLAHGSTCNWRKFSPGRRDSCAQSPRERCIYGFRTGTRRRINDRLDRNNGVILARDSDNVGGVECILDPFFCRVRGC